MNGRRWLGIITALPALSFASSALAADEVQAYGVANFGHSGECETDTSLTHSVHTATAAAFRNEFTKLKNFGLWDEVATLNNTSVRGTQWTDLSKEASCRCSSGDMATNAGADEADVVYIHTHGTHDAPVGSFLGASTLIMGSSSADCEVRTDDNMVFGNPATSGDLEIAVVKACQSGDYDVWKAGGYLGELTTVNGGMTMWNAFHGDSSCGSNVTSYVESYAGESAYDGVGENWIDEAYSWGWLAADDDCPVSIVFGSTSAARDQMYEYGGWKDRKSTGSKSASTIYYVKGCAPANGRVLPS